MKFFIGNKSKAMPGLVLMLSLVVLAIAPAVANATVTPSVTATYGSLVPGAHTDYTVNHSYTYSGVPNGAVPSGLEPTAPGSADDLKRWIIDSPAGLVGNPNAVPYAERCTAAQFALANPLGAPSCPAASIVGSATLTLGSDGSGGTAAVIGGGTIYLLQTDPEIPTTLMTSIPATTDTSPTCAGGGSTIPIYIKTASVIGPWTNGDYRLQTKSQANSGRPRLATNVSSTGLCLFGHIKGIQQHLFGVLSNGNAFLTNPTRCDSWNSYLYGNAYDNNGNVNSDPNETGTNDFVKSAADSQTPDCSALPAFGPTQTQTFNTVKRNTAPVATFTAGVTNVPGTLTGAKSGSVPRKLVVTFPKTLSINGAALPMLCSVADRAAKSCPASSKVGTVNVETPLESVALSGDVFAVTSPNQVPDLAMHVKDPRTGGLDFWVGSTSQLVNSQVITTFDDLPQVGFSKFALTIDAGTTGFLKIRACPSSAARPPDGPITYQFTSYDGQAQTITNTPVFAECVGINKLEKPPKCVANKLNVHPTYASRNNMRKAELFIDGHRVSTNRKSRYTWKKSVENIDSGRHSLKVRAFYKSGKKAYKKIKWTRC